MRRLALFVVAVMLLGSIPLQTTAVSMDQSLGTADVIFNAWDAAGNLGYDLAIVGDVNDDGIDDIIMTDNTNDSLRGNAYLFFGTDGVWNTDLSQANVTFWTPDTGASLSRAFRVGDINGDGIDDFILGEPDQDDPFTNSGSAYIYFGKANGWNRYQNVTHSNATINGTQMFDTVGEIVAGLGDVNGDGRDDFAITTLGRNLSRGYVWLFMGKRIGWNRSMNLSHASASFYGQEQNAFAGYSVDGGDVNGDGLNDLIIGAPGNDSLIANYYSPGYTYIVFGMEDGWSLDVNLSDDANASLMGEHWDDYAGQSVACAGDVNDDGFEDILVGTTQNDEVANRAGKAYLYLGHSDGWTTDFNLSNANASFRGEATMDHAGSDLSTAGDINGDGLDDFMISAPLNDDGSLTDQGQTYFYYGRTSGWTTNASLANADGSWLGESDTDWAPYSFSGGGDVNGDLLDDILIGAVRGANTGRAYLFFPFTNTRPTSASSVEIFSDEGLTAPISYAEMGQPLYIKLTATDGDPANVNFAQVKITSSPWFRNGFTTVLKETGANTGIFTGNFSAQNYTHESHRWIEARNGTRVRVASSINNSVRDYVSIGGGVSIDRLWLSNNDDKVIYAEMDSYAFRVNVTDTLRYGHIDHVNLSFPLASGRINYTWKEDPDTFEETEDPGYFARLDNTSGSWSSQWNRNRVYLWFKIYFNFTFPDELYHTVVATVVTDDGEVDQMMVVDAYRVETDLDFYGDMQVKDSIGKVLHDGDVLQPGKEITFTNAMVVYQGTTDVFPHDDFFDVIVEDDDGEQWIDNQSHGAYFHITANVTNVTDDTEIFNVTIIGVPESSVNRSLSISFKVDGDQVSFFEPTPSADRWQAKKDIMATVNITDTGSSNVKANSIEYRIKLNEADWGVWTHAMLTGDSSSINASVTITLADGPSNMIQWRAEDVAGNRDLNGNKTTSDQYVIMVDTVPPALEGAYPLEGNISKNLSVTFGINVSDIWSMVDGSTIEYTISTDDRTTWSNWMNAGHSGSGVLYECEATAEFENGTDNYVKWRVSDMLGNGPAVSEPHQIVIDTSSPPPANRDPIIEAIPDQSVKVGSILLYQTKATDPDDDTLFFLKEEGPAGLSISITGMITFPPTSDDEGVHNVTIRVRDTHNAFNLTSFKVTVVLERPTLNVSNPEVLDGDLKKAVTVQGTAMAGVGQVRSVQYQIDRGAWTDAQGTETWSFTFDTTGLTDGEHVLVIRANDDASSFDAKEYNFTVKNKKEVVPPVDTGLGNLLYIIIVVVIVIIVVALIVALKVRKGKGPAPEGGTPPDGAPPGGVATTEEYQQQPPPEEHYQDQSQQEEQYQDQPPLEVPQGPEHQSGPDQPPDQPKEISQPPTEPPEAQEPEVPSTSQEQTPVQPQETEDGQPPPQPPHQPEG